MWCLFKKGETIKEINHLEIGRRDDDKIQQPRIDNAESWIIIRERLKIIIKLL